MSGTISFGSFVPRDDVVSSLQREICETVINIWMSLSIAAIGVVTNWLVMAVFTRQGMKDSVSISLMAIAVWDQISCICAIIHRLYGPIRLIDPVLGISWDSVSLPTISNALVTATVISGSLSSYVAFERCICVTYPFAVKSIFTPGRTLCIVVVISLTVFGTMSVFSLGQVFFTVESAVYNRTITVYGPSTFLLHSRDIILPYYNTMSLFWPSLSFAIMTASTAVIIVKLKDSSKFRNQARRGDSSTKHVLSKKDAKITKMLLVVVIICLISILPRLIVHGYRLVDTRLYDKGERHNLFWVAYYVFLNIAIMNSAVNFFVYFKMSSTFRETFFSFIPCTVYMEQR